ncbi:MAG: hypothetical protein U0802_19780 [Candidatus Binatia bacterium]
MARSHTVDRLASLLLLLTGCTSALPVQPALRVPATTFRQQVRSFCVVPLRTEVKLEGGDEKLAAIEAQLTSALAGAGYGIVAPAQVADAYRRALERLGGFYDPHTGQADPLRYGSVREQARAAVLAELGCDATLQPTIAVVTAPFYSSDATWDGATERVGGSIGTMGWTPALSLRISIRDGTDRELLFCTGGIQTVSRIESGFWEDSFAPVPEAELLRGSGRIHDAIFSCLGPILAPAPDLRRDGQS